MLRHALTLTFLTLSLVACGESQGEERGPCYGNGTCNTGLVCLSDVCVRDTGAPDAGSDLGVAPDLGSATDLGADADAPDAAVDEDASAADASMTDAGVDASTIGAACDPWGVSICAPGERCRADVTALFNTSIAVGVCQAAGALAPGSPCNFGAADECMEGYACVHGARDGFPPLSGVCRPLCGRDRGACASPTALCTGGTADPGVCFESCNPLGTDCAESCIPYTTGGPYAFLCMGGRGTDAAGSGCDSFYVCAPGTFCEAFTFRSYTCVEYCSTSAPVCTNGATCTVLDGTVGYCPTS